MIAGCHRGAVGATREIEGSQVKTPPAAKPVEAVLKEQTGRLLAMPGVVGTAQGLCGGNPCIKVYVEGGAAEAAREIPATLEGYPVQVERTGEIRALPENGARPGRTGGSR